MNKTLYRMASYLCDRLERSIDDRWHLPANLYMRMLYWSSRTLLRLSRALDPEYHALIKAAKHARAEAKARGDWKSLKPGQRYSGIQPLYSETKTKGN